MYDNRKSSVPCSPPFIDNALECARTHPPLIQHTYSISATLLDLDISTNLYHTPIFCPNKPTTLSSQNQPCSLSALAPAFTPQSFVSPPSHPPTLACLEPPHFQGCSNSDNDIESPSWSKNLGYISGPEVSPLAKPFKIPSEESEDEWVTVRGSEEEGDWHVHKEVYMKKNLKMFDQMCLQFKDNPQPRRSKRLTELKAKRVWEKN